MRSLVITPTYNERDNLPRLLPTILSQGDEFDVLVVDDGSPDGTGEIADAWARRTSRVLVLHRAGKLGLGTAYIAGFKHALDRGYDAVFEMDADFSHDPADLPVMAVLVELGGLNEALAAGCAAETAILTNFALNDRWTFADSRTGLSTIGRAARYNLVALGGLLVSVAIVAGLTRGLGLHYLPANLLAIGAAFGWNYVLTSQFAWAVQPTMSESEPVRAR